MNMPLDAQITQEAHPVDTAETEPSRPDAIALPTPAQLRAEIPAPAYLTAQIERQRKAIRDILQGRDDRILMVIGPCSIHDEVAALEYGERLAALADEFSDHMLVVMRAYL